MIWFRIKKLEQKIVGNQLSDKEGLYYLIATAIALYFTGVGGGVSLLITFLIELPITVLTILIVYKINSDIDDKDFFKRFLAINWVVSIDLLIYILIFIILMVVLTITAVQFFNVNPTLYQGNASLIKNIVMSESVVIVTAFYCLLMVKSFKRLKLNFQKVNV